jgi:hypothetical protein
MEGKVVIPGPIWTYAMFAILVVSLAAAVYLLFRKILPGRKAGRNDLGRYRQALCAALLAAALSIAAMW